jgi:hypothetical protein
VFKSCSQKTGKLPNQKKGTNMDTNLVNTVPARPASCESAVFRHKLTVTDAREAQVMVPEAVDVPLPKPADQQLAVPASINGRDLSEGRP